MDDGLTQVSPGDSPLVVALRMALSRARIDADRVRVETGDPRPLPTVEMEDLSPVTVSPHVRDLRLVARWYSKRDQVGRLHIVGRAYGDVAWQHSYHVDDDQMQMGRTETLDLLGRLHTHVVRHLAQEILK